MKKKSASVLGMALALAALDLPVPATANDGNNKSPTFHLRSLASQREGTDLGAVSRRESEPPKLKISDIDAIELIGPSGCVLAASPHDALANEDSIYSQIIGNDARPINPDDEDVCTIEVVQTVTWKGAACDQAKNLLPDVYAGSGECEATSPGSAPVATSKAEAGHRRAARTYNVCAELLENIVAPFREFNCIDIDDFPANVQCLIQPHCCIPLVCIISPDCGLSKIVMKVIASAGDVHCFGAITAADLWNRIREGLVRVDFSELAEDLWEELFSIARGESDLIFDHAKPLHPDVIGLLEEIWSLFGLNSPLPGGSRALDNTPWDSAVLENMRIDSKANLGSRKYWINKHAMTLGHVVLFTDTTDLDQLKDPPKNTNGDPLTLENIQDGDVDDPSGNFAQALSAMLSELVHVKQYSEMGASAFYRDYLLEVVFNGYDGGNYEAEAKEYRNISPFDICGVYCIELTGDEAACRAECPKRTFRTLQDAPVAVCTDIDIPSDPDRCEMDADINGGSYDNDSPSIDIEQMPPGPYPMGATDVELIVTDDYTASDTCSGNVIVRDVTAPVISCPADMEIEVDEDCKATIPPRSASAVDNCDDIPDTDPQGGSILEVFDVAVHTFKATDVSGNTGSCKWRVEAIDKIAPTISAPSDLTVECDAIPDPGTPLTSDNCAVSKVDYDGETRINGGCDHEYTLERTWTDIDTSGNTASDTQTINVQDTSPPSIRCNVHNISPSDVNMDFPVEFTPTATDNCSADNDISVKILDKRCFKVKEGKKIKSNCNIGLDGDTARVFISGGVGTRIKLEVEATDLCGNTSKRICSLLVERK